MAVVVSRNHRPYTSTLFYDTIVDEAYTDS